MPFSSKEDPSAGSVSGTANSHSWVKKKVVKRRKKRLLHELGDFLVKTESGAEKNADQPRLRSRKDEMKNQRIETHSGNPPDATVCPKEQFFSNPSNGPVGEWEQPPGQRVNQEIGDTWEARSMETTPVTAQARKASRIKENDRLVRVVDWDGFHVARVIKRAAESKWQLVHFLGCHTSWDRWCHASSLAGVVGVAQIPSSASVGLDPAALFYPNQLDENMVKQLTVPEVVREVGKVVTVKRGDEEAGSRMLVCLVLRISEQKKLVWWCGFLELNKGTPDYHGTIRLIEASDVYSASGALTYTEWRRASELEEAVCDECQGAELRRRRAQKQFDSCQDVCVSAPRRQESGSAEKGRVMGDDQASEEWRTSGSAWLQRRLLREFPGSPHPTVVGAVVTGWISGEENGGLALWHVEHDDGDEEDLEEYEVMEAARLAFDTLQQSLQMT